MTSWNHSTGENKMTAHTITRKTVNRIFYFWILVTILLTFIIITWFWAPLSPRQTLPGFDNAPVPTSIYQQA